MSATELVNGIVKDSYFSMNPFCSVVSVYAKGIHFVSSNPNIYFKTLNKIGETVSVLVQMEKDEKGNLCGNLLDVVN